MTGRGSLKRKHRSSHERVQNVAPAYQSLPSPFFSFLFGSSKPTMVLCRSRSGVLAAVDTGMSNHIRWTAMRTAGVRRVKKRHGINGKRALSVPSKPSKDFDL